MTMDLDRGKRRAKRGQEEASASAASAPPLPKKKKKAEKKEEGLDTIWICTECREAGTSRIVIACYVRVSRTDFSTLRLTAPLPICPFHVECISDPDAPLLICKPLGVSFP